MPSLRILLILIAGLALGAIGAAFGPVGTQRTLPAFEVVGTLWINAIRMTVIPLVFALVVTGVAGTADGGRVGRLTAVAVPVFVVLLVAGGVLALLLAPVSIDRIAIAPEVAESLRAGSSAAQPAAMPSLAQRLLEIVPPNPIRAAADAAILPLVVFALLFGLALLPLESRLREPIVRFFQGVSEAMLVMVGWVLRAAPVGIFALAVVLGARMGAAAAGALLQYVVTLSAVLFIFTVGLYPIAILVGRASPRAFAAAAIPAQAVAFSTRSSLAALPAMIAGARDRMALQPVVTGYALPLAVSLFRVNVPIAWVVGVLFLARLYGIDLDLGQMLGLILTSTLLSFSVPGIPSASLFLMAPVLVSLGIPAEGVAILIAVDAIPDMFKTLANVTAHLTSASIVARFDLGPIEAAATENP